MDQRTTVTATFVTVTDLGYKCHTKDLILVEFCAKKIKNWAQNFLAPKKCWDQRNGSVALHTSLQVYEKQHLKEQTTCETCPVMADCV